MFSDRYLYFQHRTRLEGRRHLLWPVYVWKVLYPADDLRFGTNLFQEAILGLIRSGVRDIDQMGQLLVLDPELVRYIIATQLQPEEWLDATFAITKKGERVLDEAEDSRLNLKVGYAFQSAIDGAWLPRFTSELPEIAPVGVTDSNRPIFVPNRDTGYSERPFVLGHQAQPKADVHELHAAYRTYRKDLTMIRRQDLYSGSEMDFQAVETITDEPTRMYLWCELYRDESEPQPWLVSDPFRLRKAAAWMRKPFLDIAPRQPQLLHLMQNLLPTFSPDQCSAEEWLRRVEDSVTLQLLANYPFLAGHDVILDHLGRVLRLTQKLEGRKAPHVEEVTTLLSEAINLIEAVLQWVLSKWPTDTASWEGKKNWSRDEAKEEFKALKLSFVSQYVIGMLSGLSRSEIFKAIRYRDRPLKALLAGSIFCAGKHPDHAFLVIAAKDLALDRVIDWTNLRNKKGSAHASGLKASPEEAISAARFAINWVTLFSRWY